LGEDDTATPSPLSALWPQRLDDRLCGRQRGRSAARDLSGLQSPVRASRQAVAAL